MFLFKLVLESYSNLCTKIISGKFSTKSCIYYSGGSDNSSYHKLVEEVQPCYAQPSVSVKAADFDRTFPDQQNKASSQETQQGEGNIDKQLQEERGESQATPSQLKDNRCHHAQAESRDEPERGVAGGGWGGRHEPLFSSGAAAAPSSLWCSGS